MNEINGYTKILGIMGDPVEHTLSPLIHNTLSRMMEHNLVYVPFHVKDKDVEAAVRGAYALNIKGMNVTVPHKSHVMKTLADVDALADKIGAVNTLVRTECGYKGYNTDILGLKRQLQSENIVLKNQNIIVLGAGGAARAVAFLCASEGAKKIYVMNRTIEKAEEIVHSVNGSYGSFTAAAIKTEDYAQIPKESYVAFQCTSVGLYPNIQDTLISDKAFYSLIHTGVDLIYKPSETRFMSLVRESKGTAFNGLKMLLYQGIIAYELWNQVNVSEEIAVHILHQLKEAL